MHTRSACVALGCAVLAATLLAAAPTSARVVPRKQCELDTSKVETAMGSTTDLSALYKQVQDDVQRHMRLAQGPDGRWVVGTVQADWLCDVARRCGPQGSIEAGMGRCLRDALRKRLDELELPAR